MNGSTHVNNDTTALLLTSSQAWIYLPASVLLGLTIIIANGFIIGFYQKKWRGSVPLMYIMIAVCDSVTGVVVLCHAFIATGNLVYVKMSNVFVLVVYAALQLCTRTSLFYNTVLTVVRTINITQPFYRINKRALVTWALLYAIFWVVVMSVDAYLMSETSDTIPSIILAFPGASIVSEMKPRYRTLITGAMFLAVPLVLPLLFGCMCAAIQIYSILTLSGISPKTPREQRMTTTIIVLSRLSLLCNGPYTILFLLRQYTDVTNHLSKTSYYQLFYGLCILLPFIQAMLNPVILLIRGSAIRSYVRNSVKSALTRRSTVELEENPINQDNECAYDVQSGQ